MRDIVKVIDAVLAEIPAESTWTLTHYVELEGIRDDAATTAPEALIAIWMEANAIVRRMLAGELQPWQQRVADIWSGRTEVQS